MKKIFFTFSLLLLSFWTIQAQQDGVKVRFGGTAGFNMSKWGGDFADLKTTFRPGFHIGGVAEMMLNEKWSIQPELLFSYEGTDASLMDKGISAMYIKLPILLYYNFQIGRGRLSPGVGGYCASGIAGKIGGEEDLFKYLEKFDWGVEAKIAYELLGQKGNGFFFGAGISQGFSKTHSTALLLSIGYKFPYSKWLSSTYYKNIPEVKTYEGE